MRDLEFEICNPKPDALIQSLRSVGYDLSMAIADIIDNSISANAKNIWVDQFWEPENPCIKIIDDGRGMTEKKLFEAMAPGSSNPLETRNTTDLGRFGMGLKTASFSQCKLLTVRTKCSSGSISTRCWDLDIVNKKKEWLLRKEAYQSSEVRLKDLKKLNSGTIVLWEKLDRLFSDQPEDNDLAVKNYYKKLEAVEKNLSMIFHRYLEAPNKRITIFIGDGSGHYNEIKPWDPFIKRHQATQYLSNEVNTVFGNTVSVKPYVLPHKSNFTATEHTEAGGPKGWNSHQGIYLYRKDRMIISGGWLDLGYKQEDHYKLARIQVDIPNSMDQEWHLDVKKASAKIPDGFRDKLLRISKLTRDRASDIYRHRGKSRVRKYDTKNRFVWKKSKSKDYVIDRNHPVIDSLINELGGYKGSLKELIKLIEFTVPVDKIFIDKSEESDEHQVKVRLEDLSFDINELYNVVVESYVKKGMSKEKAIELVGALEPFIYYSELIGLNNE